VAAHVLRGYQSDGLARVLEAYRAGARSVLMTLPTGGGKTSCFAHLTAQITAPVLILVHRRELATQAANRLGEFGVTFGYEVAGMPRRPSARVQIASVQSLVRRRPPPAGLVICDEAHLSTAATWAKVLGCYPRARILGCTATPWRLSGKPLAGAYDACVVVATPAELREQGHLCDYHGFSYLAPDLSDVKTTAGDYNEKQSAAAMRQPAIVANVVEQWLAHARELSTIVFAVTVEHSKDLCAQFKAAGVAAEHLDGSTPLGVRQAILKRLEAGTTRVLCNVGVAIEGLDVPRVKCIVLARPTKSLARYLQMCGRGRRPWGGLKLRIHDHAFLIRQHGLPDDERDYTLNAKPERPPSLTQCEICFASYRGPRCPACAHENEAPPPRERELVTVPDAEIFEFDSASAPPATPKPGPDDLPPVAVRWDTPGREVEGVYTARGEQPAAWGAQRVYTLRGAKRRYLLPGTAHLDSLMGRAALGHLVRVKYLGEQILPDGRRTKKLFRVGVDDGS
jgi:DNA repair protein RadD